MVYKDFNSAVTFSIIPLHFDYFIIMLVEHIIFSLVDGDGYIQLFAIGIDFFGNFKLILCNTLVALYSLK